MSPSSLPLLLFLSFLVTAKGTTTTLTFVNNCGWTVWPGILSNAGSQPFPATGFELPTGASRSLPAPAGWSGRLWARTGCAFDSSGNGSCATGDCSTGHVECSGKSAEPPATLAEFTLTGAAGAGGIDFYDVSLVDGYNLPMVVTGGGGRCPATGCAADLNRRCPEELRVGEGTAAACRSACQAFGRPEFCCSGNYANPVGCRPTAYSEMFKTACPKSYSYAFDDASSTFTCSGAGEYSVTFCPDPNPSLKSSKEPPAGPKTTGGLMLENDSWFANLDVDSALGLKSQSVSPTLVSSVFLLAFIIFFL